MYNHKSVSKTLTAECFPEKENLQLAILSTDAALRMSTKSSFYRKSLALAKALSLRVFNIALGITS